MGTLQFKNNASTTLSGSINNSQTSITVASGSGFPSLAGSDYFYATMYEVSTGVEINIEIVKVTATSGTNWTIVRAQDGTTARSRDGVATCYIELRWTAASGTLMLQKDNNLSDLASASTARTNLGLGSIATQASSNVSITGGTISGVTFETLDASTTIQDNNDPTKQMRFEVSGVSTGTTRTLTVPNADGTLALTSDLSSGYQPLDSDLTAIAGLSANGLIARTTTGAMSVRSITQPAAGITVTNGDGVSGNPTLALANDLSAVEGINTTGFVRRTAADTWSASALVDGDIPGALTGKTYNGLTLTSLATGFSAAGGTTSKTLTVSNTLTLAGTDGTTITFPATSGTLPLNNQTFYIGTTAVAINRASASLSLTGVNIDGTAGSATSATTATKSTNLVGGNNTTLLGALPYQSNTDTTSLLSPNTTTTRNFLRMTGTGTNGAAPAWDTVTKTDVGLSNVENTALSTWAGSANITTLGTVGTGTWNATTIGISKGGTGATTAVAAFDALSPATTLGDLIYSDGTDNVRLAGNTTTNRRFLRQTGTGTVSAAPAWDGLQDGDIPSALTGKTYNGLTLTAAATGFTVAGGATSKTLTVSNTLTLAGTDASTLNIGTGGTLGTAAFTASTAYAPAAGSANILTVGTIGSGTWQGSAIGISYGGTGATSKAAGFNALSPVTTLGDLIYGDGANSNTRLAGNTTTSKRFLTQTGNGTASAAPGWNAIVDGDVPSALTGKTYNGLTLTANATGFQIAGGTTSKTLAVSNNLTLAGTDGTTMTFPATNASIARTDAAQTFTGVQTFSSDPTLSAGTANGVVYLNGSKVATSGTDLVFNATGLGIGTNSPSVRLQTNATINTTYSTSNTLAGGVIAYIKNASTTNSTDATIRLETTGSGNIAAASISAVHTGDGASALTFGTRSGGDVTERMRLDSSGNLGLGVTPSAWGAGSQALQNGGGAVFQYNNDRIFLGQNNYIDSAFADKFIGNGYATRYRQYQGTHAFFVSTVSNSSGAGASASFTQAMTLDASGNLLVGATSSSSGITLERSGGTSAEIKLNQTGTNGRDYRIASTGSGYGSAGNLIFYDATASTERARITSGGNFLINNTYTTASKLIVAGDGTSSAAYAGIFCDSGGANILGLRNDGYIDTGTRAASPYNNTTGSAANMYVDSAGGLYRSTSSLKYKTDVQDATHGLAEVLQLRPVTYKGKNDGDTVFGGLIAEEVHAAGLTEFVQYAPDGSPDALAYGNMVSLLVKAIQEQQALITDLRARVQALEAKP